MANINKIRLSGQTYNIEDSGAQRTLSAGQGITIENNVISATGGGGKAVSGGTNISITTGETADTINCTLPITTAVDNTSLNFGIGRINSERSYSFGNNNTVGSYRYTSNYSMAVGSNNIADGGEAQFVTGYCNKLLNVNEFGSGRFNNSVSASGTFGDSGNTLFSVGNGTSNSARHNAFEIRQNGDIYLTKDGQDVKLQDQLGGGGSTYTAGDGIDITNDVISVTGKVDTSTFNTYSGSVDTALSGKQDTLSAGTNIKTINNESLLGSGNIDIQGGGGKAVSGGTNISITTGETADTINCILPFSYEGDNLKTTVSGNSFVDYFHYGQIFGINNTLQGKNTERTHYTWQKNTTIIGYSNQSLRMDDSIVIGSSNNLGNTFGKNKNNYIFGFSNTVTPGGTQDNIVNNNFVIGNNNTINKKTNNFIFGYGINPSNNDEFSLGKYNNSVSASTTFGDSGNTLFSVGNGTADNARHNAFEIRQNGDIYLTKDGQDVKLQDQLGGGGSITIDPSLDSGSTNPVANSAITKTLYTAANANGDGNGYVGDIEAKNDSTYLDRLIWGFNATRYKRPLGGSNSNNTQGVNFYCSSINGVRTVSKDYKNVGHFSLIETSAITTSITSSSTDAQVPSAKAVYDMVGNINTILESI